MCCLSPHVEATAEDLLPLAEVIVQRGEAALLLDRMAQHADDRRCILYQADPSDPARGRCSMYAQRPVICRLFGFAGRRDADGQPEFVACRIHKQSMPETVAAAAQAVRAGTVSLPIFADLAGRVASAIPGANRLLPINDALREAIQRTALAARLASDWPDDPGKGNAGPEDDGSRPTTPGAPPRLAA